MRNKSKGCFLKALDAQDVDMQIHGGYTEVHRLNTLTRVSVLSIQTGSQVADGPVFVALQHLEPLLLLTQTGLEQDISTDQARSLSIDQARGS